MRVIKKINNNAAICIDNSGKELVALGTGIGFPKVPYELDDLSKVQKTYYNVDTQNIDLIVDVSNEIIFIANKIFEEFFDESDFNINTSYIFSLADHINFAIERTENNIVLQSPLSQEIKDFHSKAYKISKKYINFINQEMHCVLPDAEIGNIALHLVNAQNMHIHYEELNFENILINVVQIIEKYSDIIIDQESVFFSRFVSHLKYLVKSNEVKINTQNEKLLEVTINQNYDTYLCVIEIEKYLKNVAKLNFSHEETLYLILHVNRLCTRNK